MFALKRDQRGAPAVAEAVRQRCSHVAATKADLAYGVIGAVLKVKRTRLAGDVSVCGTTSASIVCGASCKASILTSTLTVRWSAVHGNMHVGTHGQVKCHACELETSKLHLYDTLLVDKSVSVSGIRTEKCACVSVLTILHWCLTL